MHIKCASIRMEGVRCDGPGCVSLRVVVIVLGVSDNWATALRLGMGRLDEDLARGAQAENAKEKDGKGSGNTVTARRASDDFLKGALEGRRGDATANKTGKTS